jgi:uncharacterized cupredoxin-like copper-binding protein
MKTSWKWLAGVVVAGALVAGCGSDPNDVAGGTSASPNAVTGTEREWKIQADHKTIKAGDITFTFTNRGSVQHELLVIRTDLPVGGIPIGADGKFNEGDPAAVNVGETGEYDVGKTSTFKVKLAPGKYQLVCNIANHYKNGMHIAFTVD